MFFSGWKVASCATNAPEDIVRLYRTETAYVLESNRTGSAGWHVVRCETGKDVYEMVCVSEDDGPEERVEKRIWKELVEQYPPVGEWQQNKDAPDCVRVLA